MAEIDCLRCGNTAEGLEKAPFPGDLGSRVQASSCAACFQSWLDAQVILINEHRLNGADPKHVEYLLSQMKTFLNLEPTDEGDHDN